LRVRLWSAVPRPRFGMRLDLMRFRHTKAVPGHRTPKRPNGCSFTRIAAFWALFSKDGPDACVRIRNEYQLLSEFDQMTNRTITIDGNEAAGHLAFKTNEVIAIYPITPSSPMGESADAWSALHRKNIWGMTPLVREMQSEGGAAGAVHGTLQTGSLTTTFTSSQGLLLMIPNMFKIAGQQTSTVFHIAARSVATHALSIFGDHSDVMTTRSTGWAMLFANSVQEVMDFALIAQAGTLETRVPFLHIFDGFRTSHEVMKITELSDDQIHAMIDDQLVHAHRQRALTPDHPVMRGTAQNPDVFFQSRERSNPFYLQTPQIVQETR